MAPKLNLLSKVNSEKIGLDSRCSPSLIGLVSFPLFWFFLTLLRHKLVHIYQGMSLLSRMNDSILYAPSPSCLFIYIVSWRSRHRSVQRDRAALWDLPII